MLVLFQIFLMMARSSSLACSKFPGDKGQAPTQRRTSGRPQPPAAPRSGPQTPLREPVLVRSLSPEGHEASMAVVWVPPPHFFRGSWFRALAQRTRQNLLRGPPPERSAWGGALTFRLDSQGRADQGEESGVEGDGAVTVQRHVHAHQALRGERWAR